MSLLSKRFLWNKINVSPLLPLPFSLGPYWSFPLYYLLSFGFSAKIHLPSELNATIVSLSMCFTQLGRQMSLVKSKQAQKLREKIIQGTAKIVNHCSKVRKREHMHPVCFSSIDEKLWNSVYVAGGPCRAASPSYQKASSMSHRSKYWKYN